MAKWTLKRVYLNSGGYDDNGQYFGRGLPLYAATCDTSLWPDDQTHVFRASSRDAAKKHVRTTWDSNAVFYS